MMAADATGLLEELPGGFGQQSHGLFRGLAGVVRRQPG